MASTLKTPKDPDDTDDLTWEWEDRLVGAETISAFTATLISGDITVGSTSISGTDTICRISGGTAGTRSSIRGRMTTSTARRLDWTIRINVSEQ